TGAAVPAGADAIVRVEDTRPAGEGVLVLAPGNPNDIRRRAQDLAAGGVYLNPGRRLGPAEIALAAAMGHARLPVARRPRLGILATGDELTPPGGEIAEGGVFESNSFGLLALAQAAGWDAARLENVPDTLEATRAALDAAAGFDWLLTSGGVSMGLRDYTRQLLETEGGLAFKRVRIRPGGPVLAGRWRGLPVVGLPGNPVSALVVFQVLLWPAWWAAVGGEGPANASLPAIAAEPLRGTAGKLTFARVVLQAEGGRLAARPFRNQSSGVLRSLVESHGLAAIQEGGSIEEGESVQVLLPFR
ncbi:MAG TPA: molybdopterin molybdotransferase MoeA, partial [Deinococcales bacterium]|nr:molybdopterin molybdotransferase MoeA [Deinococcales bacterium]